MLNMDEIVQRAIAHKNACFWLDQELEGVENFDNVRCGSDGNQNRVLIVTLVIDPPEGWVVPFRVFQDYPVVWKVNGRVFAL
jgi:hypothetical protein